VAFAYNPEAWATMFEMVALAAVTLTGLLFVGLSINLRSILQTPAHRARAREALLSQLVLLVVAVFVLIPGQGPGALGVELVVVSVIVLVVSLRLQSKTLRRLPASRRATWSVHLIALNAVTIAIAVAGVGLLTNRLGGLLWLVPTILTCLLWSAYNAWSLTVHGMDANS